MNESRRSIQLVVSWLLEAAERAERAGQVEPALELLRRAANLLCRQNLELTDARVENALLRLSSGLHAAATASPLRKPSAPQKILHILNEARGFGGHTAMATRWILADRTRQYDVVLTSQLQPVPARLVTVLQETQGTLHQFDAKSSLSERAQQLRALASGYDAVVLHVAVDDVIASAAFGVAGGPPVMLVNHGAHIFWVGTRTTDLVLNCRGSELEKFWTTHYRGTTRCSTVPIPLVRDNRTDAEPKAGVRQRLGIAADALLILSVGETFKYRASPTHDFVAVAAEILRSLPTAHLVVVGVDPDERWSKLPPDVRSRLLAVGRQSDVHAFLAAADLYIEGFPFGSTTALLEAGLSGLPCVVTPADCPPPYGTDGVAIDHVVERAADAAAYIKEVLRLAASAPARAELGKRIAQSVEQHHLSPGWNGYVEAALTSLGTPHETYPAPPAVPVPVGVADYWTAFRERSGLDGSSSAVLAAEQLHSAPKLGLRLTRSVLDLGHAVRARRLDQVLSAVTIFFFFALLRPLMSNRFLGAVVSRLRWIEHPDSRFRALGRT